MDGNRFDDLVREWLTGTAPRRLVLRLSALPLAGGLAAFLLDDVESAAKKRKHKNKKKKRKRKKRKRKKQAQCDVCASGCPFSAVQAAIDAAAPGDTLTLCAGAFTGIIEIATNLTLIGTGDGAGAGNTILDGAGVGTVVTTEAGSTVTLQNLRITGGADISGGGIDNNGTLTLTDCTVSGNTAIEGGGIFNFGGTLELIDSSVTANGAGSSAGGIANNGGTVICSGSSTVSGNSVGSPPAPSNCIDDGGGTGCTTCPD